MPCNNRKDLTHLVARKRITVFESRYFFDCYLWETVEDLQAQTAVMVDLDNPFRVLPNPQDGPCAARCCRMPFVVQYTRPWWAPRWLWNVFQWPDRVRRLVLVPRDKFFPRLGELHFAQGKGWDMEIVAHEVSHAALSTARAIGVSPAGIFSFSGHTSHHLKLTPAYQAAAPSVQDDFTDEEAYCYIHGDLFNQVYRWIWTVDPPQKKGDG